MGALATSLTPLSFAIQKISPDPAAVEVLNQLLQGLLLADPNARLQAVLPLVHKSMLTPDGKDLDRNTKEFSYKKAAQGAQFYALPVEIYEVHQGNVTTIGFKETAETGRTDKYFLAKKSGIPGRPAPIHIFWDTQGKPKVVNMGSL